MNIRRKLIRTLVDRLLSEAHCTRPPVDVEAIAERNDMVIHRRGVDEDFSGYLIRNPSQSSGVIGVNSKHPLNRQRFTIAHELGHFLMHGGNNVHIDKQFLVMRRDKDSSKGTSPEEMEANLFAAELLIPEAFLARDMKEAGSFNFPDDDRVEQLAKKYRVSQQAMTIRLATLGYL
jgi:Zn-dependent peptidase ImmA (M78 family)